MSGGAEDLAASKRRPRGVVLQPSEEKDLRRVFETLAGCAKKDAKMRSKAAKLKKIEELNAKMDDQDEESNDDSESEEDIGCQIDELHEEVDALEQELKQMDDEPKKKITAHDLDHAFRTLGLPKTKKYLEYVIWETDENLDGSVDWDEFQLMYYRNMKDTTGLEPFELFNVVQFMTFDQDNKGFITEDDCMSTLFVRHGRSAVAREMEKLFGGKLKSKGGEGVLRLADYLAVSGVREVHMVEQRMGDLLKKVETLKPPKSTNGGSGIVEHEKKWKPM